MSYATTILDKAIEKKRRAQEELRLHMMEKSRQPLIG